MQKTKCNIIVKLPRIYFNKLHADKMNTTNIINMKKILINKLL